MDQEIRTGSEVTRDEVRDTEEGDMKSEGSRTHTSEWVAPLYPVLLKLESDPGPRHRSTRSDTEGIRGTGRDVKSNTNHSRTS